jgi:lipase maturation factor 1
MEWLSVLFKGFISNEYTVGQSLFLRGLGLIYLISFSSLVIQIKGLYGSKGILPFQDLLNQLKNQKKKHGFFRVPTWFWYFKSDKSLTLTCYLGIAFSCLLTLNILAPLCLVVLWCSYLSISSIGRVFMTFQWDSLLLEVGFFAFFFSLQTPPPQLLLVAIWFCYARFLFASGFVKLRSKDPTWKSLTALNYHYYTQPIPNPLSWFFHNLPQWFQKFSCGWMLFVEIVVPFSLFLPSPYHIPSVIMLMALQVLIFASGNFAFFNLLTIVMLLPIIPNSSWDYLGIVSSTNHTLVEQNPLSYFLSAVAAFLIFLNILQVFLLFGKRLFPKFSQIIAPFKLCSSYGLFASMTTKRLEFTLEGSHDGKDWREYQFTYKVGDCSERPKQVAPHQPRLDWQLWFAALRGNKLEPWLMQFITRLLENSLDVKKLIKNNPFPKKPPKFIKVNLYEYTFTTRKERKETGKYWNRKHIGTYPNLSLSPKKTQDTDNF